MLPTATPSAETSAAMTPLGSHSRINTNYGRYRYPVASLRSATGYWLASLRDGGFRALTGSRDMCIIVHITLERYAPAELFGNLVVGILGRHDADGEVCNCCNLHGTATPRRWPQLSASACRRALVANGWQSGS